MSPDPQEGQVAKNLGEVNEMIRFALALLAAALAVGVGTSREGYRSPMPSHSPGDDRSTREGRIPTMPGRGWVRDYINQLYREAESDNPYERWSAIRQLAHSVDLGWTDPEPAMRALARDTRDESPWVRVGAASALSSAVTSARKEDMILRIYTALLTAMVEDPTPQVRVTASDDIWHILRVFKDEQSAPFFDKIASLSPSYLERAALDENARVRENARRGLSWLRCLSTKEGGAKQESE